MGDGLVEAILKRHDQLDILINNVAAFLWQDVFEQTDDEWHQVLASSLSSVFYCTRAVLPAMRRHRWDWIINPGITGGQSTDPAAHMAAFVAAKARMIAHSFV